MELSKLKIDPEFRDLIPAISKEEAEELEKSIREEGGCRDALIMWDNGTLLDGHHRFEICQRYDLRYKTISKSFESRDMAKEWVIRNQLGRRNLSTMDRVNLALLLKPLIEQKAKEKEATHTNQGYQKSGNPPVHTDKELAKAAGVSHDTIHKVKVIQKKATPEQKEELQKGKKSINKLYNEIKEEPGKIEGEPMSEGRGRRPKKVKKEQEITEDAQELDAHKLATYAIILLEMMESDDPNLEIELDRVAAWIHDFKKRSKKE